MKDQDYAWETFTIDGGLAYTDDLNLLEDKIPEDEFFLVRKVNMRKLAELGKAVKAQMKQIMSRQA